MTKKMFFVCLFFYVFYLGVQIRLAGSTQCSGRVELFNGSTWGTVCDDDWDLRDAEVVCRQLSCGKALSAPGSASFGEGADPILLDDVACSGSERSLTECQSREMGKHNCEHSEDAGVVCSGKNLFCQYKKSISSQNFASVLSDPLRLSITGKDKSQSL
uniref:Soluble scavenger receptor cysteine-rich domain-containing protein SSC5D n=1 Tax=Labrus bergylta TaxID=56723 RepID=A0A3Q3L981_9LABR